MCIRDRYTAGISLFFFSTGFTNKIAWYSNVGKDGSQWKFLTDRVNSFMGPVLVWITTITVLLNLFSKELNFPLYLTSQEDGVITLTEFLMWPLWIVSIYMVVVVFCPLTIYLHKKNPYLTDVILDKRLSRFNLIYLFSLMRKIKKLNINKVYDLQNSSRTLFYKKDISILARSGFSYETSKKVLEIPKSEFIKFCKML